MELYGGPTAEYGLRVAVECLVLEELMYGLAWPGVARVRHRPQIQSCD